MKSEIFKIKVFGIMSVYQRNFYKPKYFVLRETDGHILEEFQRKQSAVKWAIANRKG